MKSLLPSFENHLPRRVIFGRRSTDTIGDVLRTNGWTRAMVVSDAGVSAAGLLQPITSKINELNWIAGTFVDVPPEPPIQTVDEIACHTIECRADVIIAIGGGSVMDAAKVASVCAHQNKLARELVGIRKCGARGLPTVLIPTTAGTGSEATFVAILTDTVSGNKVGVVDPCLLADIAIVDPSLTDRLPRHVTAATGMDALVHAIEAYIANNATPIARGLALEAARNIGSSLELVCEQPDHQVARDRMAIGSHLAGMAFANASCCAVHALALPLGGRFTIPHGVITGCFAGAMMRHNGPACEDDFADLSRALGWGALASDAFANKLDEIAARIGLLSTLHHTIVPDVTIADMSRDAVANRRLMDPNPRPVAVEDAARIYRSVLKIAND